MTGVRHDDARVRSAAAHAGDARCLAIMYHYVLDERRDAGSGICGRTAPDFRRQLDRLCDTAEAIDWASMYAWLQGRGSMPKRSFLLTFDDGLAGHARVVAPILKERGIRAVFFVCGDVLVRQRLLPVHAVHLLMGTLGEDGFRDALLARLAEEDPSLDWAASVDPAAADRMYHYETPDRARLKYLLAVTLPAALRDHVVDALFEQHVGSATRWAKEWYLNWDDLTDLEAMGHTVGGHGQCHEPCTRLGPERLRQDMTSVAAVLSGGLGPDLRPFAYPYGRCSDEVCTQCRRAGFVQAFTTERGWITAGSDPMRLPRVDTIDVETVLDEEAAVVKRR
ncbi:MAG: polysaccharide deacetylase family protein [Phycisphaerae bacterium]